MERVIYSKQRIIYVTMGAELILIQYMAALTSWNDGLNFLRSIID